MSFPENEMDDIINDFIVESMEGLESLDQKFIDLEKNVSDTTLLNDIFRSVHTIKGASGFFGFQQIVDVAHVTEDILNKLRKSEMAVNAAVMDAVLKAVDMIKALIKKVRDKNDSPLDIQPVLEMLRAVQNGRSAPVTEPRPDAAPGQPLDAETPARPPAGAERKQDETGGQKEKEHSIRVDIERLDAVMNLVGELVLSRNRLMNIGGKITEWNSENELVGHLNDALSQLDLNTTGLQLGIMKMRMQPVAKVFNKFPRMVRDLTRQSGKEVELVITGQETELDKTVIEEIGDPLVHLIRNSIDHGIEMPDDRQARGKPRSGTLELSAYQEGRNIVVAVSDDGKGIDPAIIRRSAAEKGLMSADEAERLSDRDVLNLIFLPGFSTAKTVSNISGRGVGMDVVKTNISRINGGITVDSTAGIGTSMVMRLPLTLAIIQVLTVDAGSELYGIPLSTVIENIRVRTEDIKSIEGKEAIRIRDSVYPVVRLQRLVGSEASDNGSGWKYIVIMGIGEKKFGLLVDRLRGQEEIVMKSMGGHMKGAVGVAGACITGDGNVILILDVAGLIDALDRACAKC